MSLKTLHRLRAFPPTVGIAIIIAFLFVPIGSVFADNPPPTVQNQTVFTSSGVQTQVEGSSGALTEQVKLDVPPGRNGMQPELSLNYNSQNTEQDSIVGYGWNLSIPYISRLNKTGSQDLYGPNAYFSSSLDGELVVTGTATDTVTTTVASSSPPEAYWKLDESSGDASDATGNSYTLTNGGGGTYSTGIINNGFDQGTSFSSSHVLTTNTDFEVDLSGAASVSLWVKANTDVDASHSARLFDWRSNTGGGLFMILNYRQVSGVNQLFVDPAGGTQVTYNTTLGTSSWHNIVVTYTPSGTVTLFLDGTQVQQTASARGGTTFGHQFAIGGDTSGGSAGAMSFDEVAVWSRTLSASEVTDLYNSGAGISNPGGFSGTTTVASVQIPTYRARVDEGAFRNYIYATSTNTWMMYDKNGTQYLFGTTTQSQQSATTSPDNVFRWMLEEVRDTNNNYVRYEYNKDGNQIYPYRIIYTGHDTTDGPSVVTFATSTRSDPYTSYKSGFRVDTNYRISQITAAFNGENVREYDLSYTNGANGVRSLLASVQRTGWGDGGTETVEPATTFGYFSTTTELFYVPAHTYSSGSSNITNQSYVVGDVNGNGLNDSSVFFSDGAGPASPNGGYIRADSQTDVNINSSVTHDYWAGPYPFSPNERGVRFLDVNGDGKADLVRGFYNYTSSTVTREMYVNTYATSTGYGWTSTSTWTGTIPDFAWDGSGSLHGLTTGLFGDVNGDGLPDFEQRVDGQTGTGAYLGNGSAWDNATTTAFVPVQSLPAFGSPITNSQLIDINGDGLVDWVYSDDTHTYVDLNNGRGWNSPDSRWTIGTSTYYKSTSPGSTYYDRGIRFFDINGDGLPDMVHAYSLAPYSSSIAPNPEVAVYSDVFLNTASGWATSTSYVLPSDIATGVLVSGQWQGQINNNEYENWLGNGQMYQDVLSTVSYPQGGSTTVTYGLTTEGGANPELPISLLVIKKAVTQDGLGNNSEIDYGYAGGKLYLTQGPREKKFAGFSSTTATSSSSVITTYYSQGDATSTSMGEQSDGYAQINHPFREDIKDLAGNLAQRTFYRWDTDAFTASSTLLHLGQKMIQSFDSDSSHKDKAVGYVYASSTDNLIKVIDYGEVRGNSDGTFEDTDSTASSFPTSGLVAYWNFDESSGTAADSSGNGHTLTNNNSITFSSGKIGNAATFSKSSNQYFSIPSGSASAFGLTQMSVSVWVKANTNFGTQDKRPIISKFSANTAGYSFGYGTEGGSSPTYYTALAQSGNDTQGGGGSTPNDGSWHHLVVTYDGAGSNNATIKWYLDGSLTLTQTSQITVNGNTGASLVIGGPWQDGSPSNAYWDGQIDEMGVWNRVLDTTDVSTLYNGGDGSQYGAVASSTVDTDDRVTLLSYAASSSINLYVPTEKIVAAGSTTTIATSTLSSIDVNVLVVGGGGGGGSPTGSSVNGGGGGGGGVNTSNSVPVSVDSYTVTVGAGGASGSGDGSNSSFSSLLSALGGGGGGGAYGAQSGHNGGSGGGGGDFSGSEGTGTSGQGNDGAPGGAGSVNGAGGGGGAGATASGKTGGSGAVYNTSGSSVTYGGGGGGGKHNDDGLGGSGGGGNGGTPNGSAGTANTGGGGGGAGTTDGSGGAGGSGIVIISAPEGVISATGGTHTTSGGNDIWTFTSSGTWTVTGIVASENVPSVEGLVSDDRYLYDNLSFGSVALGNQTEKQSWISGTKYASSTKAYNIFGLVENLTDARGNETSYVYDSFDLYPATTTNPLSQQTQRTYNYTIGKTKHTIDPNGGMKLTLYDGVGRPLEVSQSESSAPTTLATTTTYVYTDSTTTPSVIHQTDYLTSTSTVDTYSYYDGLNRLIQERHSTENVATSSVRDLTYNAAGLLASESLPYFSVGTSRTSASSDSALFSEFTYDALNRPLTAVNAVGTTTTSYSGWTNSITDPNGHEKSYRKDAFENLVQVNEVNSGSTYSTYYFYDMGNRLTGMVDAEGNTRGFGYDGLGRRLTAQDLHAPGDSSFGTWTYSYDDAGNMASSTNPKAQEIDYTYDNLNRPLSEDYTGSSGTEVTYTYDSCTNGIGRLCAASSSAAQTSNNYDILGRLVSATTTISNASYGTSYAYDLQGNVTSVMYPDNRQVNYTYNIAGLLGSVSTKGPSDSVFAPLIDSFSYAPTRQPATVEFANGVETVYTYDPNQLYRLTRVLTGSNATTTIVSNQTVPTTNLVSYWTLDEPSGTRADSTATGNTLTDNNSTPGATGKISNGADFEKSNNQWLSHTDNASLSITGDISISAWMKLESLPGTGEGYTLVAKTNGGSDKSYRLKYRNDSGTPYFDWQQSSDCGSVNSELTYNTTLNTGQWYHIVATFEASTHTRKLYIDGSAITPSSDTGTVTSICDSTAPFMISSEVTSGESFFDGVVDEVGIWSGVLSSGDVTNLYNGGSGTTYGTSTPSFYTYYQNLLQDTNYTYDALGNITDIVENATSTNTGRTVVFSYDDLNRLLSASTTAAGSNPYSQTFAYDPLGNITNKSDIGDYTYASSTYANPHAPVSVNGTTYTYDNNGNLTAASPWTYTWDYHNRLTNSNNGSATTTYGYDYSGQRVFQVSSAGTITYPSKYFSITSTQVGSTTYATSTDYVYAGDTLLAYVEQPQINGTATGTPATYYVHPDHLGSTNAISDSSGNLVTAKDYFPYGSVRINSGSASLGRGYISQFEDNTGLDYENARYYDPARGQFISQDPMFLGDPKRQDLANPQDLSSYSYAIDNPINKSDPTGLWYKEFITGQQSWPSFYGELGDAANQLGQQSPGWNFAFNHPYTSGALVGVGSIPALYSGVEAGGAAYAAGLATYLGGGASFIAQQSFAALVYSVLTANSISGNLGTVNQFANANPSQPTSILGPAGSLAWNVGSSLVGGYTGATLDAMQFGGLIGQTLGSAATNLYSNSIQTRTQTVNNFNSVSGLSSGGSGSGGAKPSNNSLWVTPSGAVVNFGGQLISQPPSH